jgi:hypothetical protein
MQPENVYHMIERRAEAADLDIKISCHSLCVGVHPGSLRIFTVGRQYRSLCNFVVFTRGSERPSLRLTAWPQTEWRHHDARPRHPAQGHEYQR